MKQSKGTIALIGNSSVESLERSYERSFRERGYETVLYNISESIDANLPIAKVTRKLRRLTESRKALISANRELAIRLIDLQPEIIAIFCNAEVTFNTLALLKTATDAKIVLIWPDSPFSLTPEISLSAPMYDLVCTYSNASVHVFERIGCRAVMWLPLAADPDLHKVDSPAEKYTYDVSFIGNWRPEREETMLYVVKNFKDLRVCVSGTMWRSKAKNKSILRYVNEVVLTGRDYASFINQSLINLNIVDRTNFPAANMRFFEIPVCYGLQLSSSCPEQEHIYLEGQHVLYYDTLSELQEKIRLCLNNPEQIGQIRHHSHDLTLTEHTYAHRVEKLLTKVL